MPDAPTPEQEYVEPDAPDSGAGGSREFDPDWAEHALAGTPEVDAESRHESATATTESPDSTAPPTPGVFVRTEALAAIALGIAVLSVAGWRWISAESPPPVEVIRPADGAAVPAYRLRVDINRDPWERLTLVPGIGEVTARRIVDHRDAFGPFASLADLDRVEGISTTRIAAWSPYLVCTRVGAADVNDS